MSHTPKFCPCASLALIGQEFQKLKIWSVVESHVVIEQKACVYRPTDKLLDLFISMLTGSVGVVEVNQRVRPDQILQRAFGRQGCAEQSSISRTLNACTTINVEQMRQVVIEILHQIGRCVRHNYAQGPLVLDVDMMSMPTECAGEGVEKGYFSYHHGRRGRQIARVCASAYNEMLIDRLYSGKRQLESNVLDLVAEVEPIFKLNEPDAETLRKQVVYRLDAGGGTTTIIDGLLARDYAVLTKMHSWRGVKKLLESVTLWIPDPKISGRSIGWVTQGHHFCRPTRQLGIRFCDGKGKQHQAVLVSSLSINQIAALLHQPLTPDELERSPWLLLHVYDDRSGGVETQNRNDRQGLGIAQHHEHAFAAEEMKLLLCQLAHNFIVHISNELVATDAHFATYAHKRMIRDVFHIPGNVYFSNIQQMHVVLNRKHPLSAPVQATFRNRYV